MMVVTKGTRKQSRRIGGMSRRTAAWLAWSLWAVTLALVVGGLLLGVANRPEAPLYEYWLESTLINPTFATLGALIISRRPENVIGWIFCVSSIAGGIQMFSGQYATVALFSSETRLPGGAVAAWLSTLMQTSVVAAALFLILLFLTGRSTLTALANSSLDRRAGYRGLSHLPGATALSDS